MLLVIDSRKRTFGTSTDFLIALGTSFKEKQHVKLVSAYVPNTIYNITSANNKITVLVEDTPDEYNSYVATITPGKYSISSITSALKTALDAAGATEGITFNISIDVTTFKCTITASASCKLSFVGNDSPYLELGFEQQETSDTTTHVGSNTVQLNRPTVVYIKIDEFKPIEEHIHLAGGVGGYYYPTFVLPLANSGGDIGVFREASDYKQGVCLSSPAYGNLHVRLTDDVGTVIDLNGADWSFVLEVCFA